MSARLKTLALAVAVAATIVATVGATANAAPTLSGPALAQPAGSAPAAVAPVEEGATLAPPEPAPSEAPAPAETGTGGTTAPVEVEPESEADAEAAPETTTTETGAGAIPSGNPAEALLIPSLPSSSCSAMGVPPVLIPIYHRAASAYGLGPQGPAVLAGINEIETAFGTNTNVSSAGAQGWMQFMPETWAAYGVDANGDGVKDPYNPEDAIFAAANYLKASGFPEDVYGAIYAYNHADWYVQDVLAKASCHSQAVSAGGAAGFALTPQMPVLECKADKGDKIPADYMQAFESAAARYELGRRGVWTLAAIARLESDYGRGMTKKELRTIGPLGIDGIEWRQYAVDGNEDGRIRRASPADSAATLARLIWSRGSIGAGVFTHNQAEWYVDAVDREATRLEGDCIASTVEWAVALPGSPLSQINWENLVLSNEMEMADIQSGALDPRVLALLALMTQKHQITISSLRSDHSMMTASGNVSNHYYGRAMDIAAVDGVSCTDTAPTSPCAQLGFALAQLQEPLHPNELIYCFDLDGPGPAFALPDHCDHIHAGFEE
ncbi:MAG TPA: lytic murein transglycosylase [Solirubrobacterales bacterium]|nr:lytic murein transglycosylase [Solirubrobacterales bacterium]